MSGEQRRFELSVPQVLGGALAAVTAAVAASFLGVAGTVIGAAVASIASTVGSAIYTHYLKRTGEKVKEHTVLAWREHTEDGPPLHRDGEGELATAVHATVRQSGQDTAETGPFIPVTEPPADTATLEMAAIDPEPDPDPEPRRPLPWLKLGVAAGAIFAVSMGGILAFQAVTHKTMHETVTGQNPARQQQKAPARNDDKPADQPVTTPTTRQPEKETPTPTPTPTKQQPTKPAGTPDPTPTPTESGSVEPSGEPSPDPVESTGAPDPADENTPPADEAQQNQGETEQRG
ncbi:hypothetical protein OIE66_09825 [Nonomuraea sp. NBC_01738]|uniref:hypothetical protein n=1 Tax=Nonomuraea sp. NBC_01738 TaxID=2976003 RepID=UPI002E114E42|nr:hypothetical protein OIE66_09825 [Nonomuraea sp. NBC_01738]